MSGRYRLNLEAPFLQSASFGQALTSKESFQQAAYNDAPSSQDSDVHSHRPSPENRAKGDDYTGKSMARYIEGLEARMLAHLRKHSPHWHQKETEKILRRWSAPQLPAPAPRWAPPIDRRTEAKEYAAALLNERIRKRLDRFSQIRSNRLVRGGIDDHPKRSVRMTQ